MKHIDVQMLTPAERTVVDNGFDRNAVPVRFRNIILGVFAAMAVALVLLALEASATTIAFAFMAYIGITALEKVSYVRGQMLARGALRKLVHRIESLEGVPHTPDNAAPTQKPARKHSNAA